MRVQSFKRIKKKPEWFFRRCWPERRGFLRSPWRTTEWVRPRERRDYIEPSGESTPGAFTDNEGGAAPPPSQQRSDTKEQLRHLVAKEDCAFPYHIKLSLDKQRTYRWNPVDCGVWSLRLECSLVGLLVEVCYYSISTLSGTGLEKSEYFRVSNVPWKLLLAQGHISHT